MVKRFRKFQNRINNNLGNIVLEGIVTTIVLSILFISISINIIRVFSSGQSNYATFIQEKEELDKLQSKNDLLKQEYTYVNSDEFKKLFLRDSQNVASSQEQLFKTRDLPTYYQETPDYLNTSDKKNFNDWWISLIR